MTGRPMTGRQNADSIPLELLAAKRSELVSDPEYGAKTSKGIGLRYAVTILDELTEGQNDGSIAD